MNLSPTVFPIEIASYRELIDRQLERYTQFDVGCPPILAEAIRYVLLAPGKRIRPSLVLSAAELCGGQTESALPAACAVEMIHNYSLVHDDLPAMDDDDLRRGRPTCHRQYDEATAILVGDALIPLAFEVIARDTRPVDLATRSIEVLARAAGATSLVGGQADDLGQEFAEPNVDLLEQIHHRKTGALLTASLELGAISAQADEKSTTCLKNFGKYLGLAFQIADDLLDLKGSEVTMGKKTGKDAGRGKLTYPSVLGVEQSELRARQMSEAAIASLEPFGPSARPLQQLAHFVVHRTH